MRNYKRLFKILKGNYRYLVFSLILILLIQSLNFIQPLLVKGILDDCILGIEYEWVEVDAQDQYTVLYNNKLYKQKRYLNENETFTDEASIVLFKGGFYFADSRISDGLKDIDGNTLTVKNSDNVYTYHVEKLSKSEIMSFYKPIYKTLIKYIILLFLEIVLAILFSYFQQMSTNRVINYLARDGRTLAMQAVERLPISVFESEPAGKMASRITTDVDGLIILYRQIINLFTNALLSFTFAYVGMFLLDYKLALLSFVIYPLVFIWIKFFLKKLKVVAERFNETRSMLTAKINEIINGIHILQIFNFKKQTIEEFDNLNEKYRRDQLSDVKLSITAGWNLINVLKGLITTLIVAYFGFQYVSIAGVTITAGLIYAYNEYLLKLVSPIQIVFSQISEFQHSHVRMDRIHKLIEGEKEDDSKEIIPRYKGDIKFDNIWFSYVKNDYVLKGVSFDIKQGQMVGLVGHTGSGKSSLMNLLLRFYDLNDPLSGSIYVDGIDIKTYSKRTYREHIGIVLQEPVMFKGTIASNIRFGKDDVSDEEIERIFKSIGGEKILNKFEKGINQEISRSGNNLSSGEKQMISLARAIVHDPAILIMDEATSHIDIETEEMVKQALKVVCMNRTVIVIAHRLSTIFNADNIIVLDHGLKAEEGTHNELVKKNGVYANIYRAQVSNIEES
ncbi:MAG: ABC transporter ATP-binding protein/permease [Acholeplasmataceae bacterium]|nr:ABC transporter ATP-binding protein/permease [Acholeplasmataceae bacterium]